MFTIIITTFYPQNLRMSLTRLKWLNFDFNLIIHNDNPDISLTRKMVKEYGYDGAVIILNEEKNQGCYLSRINSIKYMLTYLKNTTHFIFCDDDDILLFPDRSDHVVTNQHAFTVFRLREQLSLMVEDPREAIEKLRNLNDERIVYDERPKMGCVGVTYRTELWEEMMPYLDAFFPILARWYKSPRIMEPDDVLLMIWINRYILWSRGTWEGYYYQSPNYAYSLTMLEDRAGRYMVEPQVLDIRYGNHHDESLYAPMKEEFVKLVDEFLRSSQKPKHLLF